MSGSPMWFLTRGSGIVALLLLTISVVLGIVNQVRWRNDRWPRFALQDVHKNVSLLAVAIVGLHVVTSVFDSFAPIGWQDVVVPFLSSYRPLWLGLGTLALDMFLAILLTSLIRTRIGPRIWRAVHWLSYACWPVALLHSVGTGSDIRSPWVQGLAVASTCAVVAAVWWRIAAGWPSARTARIAAVVASIVLPLSIAAFSFVGPLAKGWAKASGTPARLLEQKSTTIAATPTLPSVPFNATFDGAVSERRSPDRATETVVIKGTLDDGASLEFEIRGQPLAGGGVSMQSSGAIFGTRDQPSIYRGRIVALRGTAITAQLTAPQQPPLELHMQLEIDGGGHATGSVEGVDANG